MKKGKLIFALPLLLALVLGLDLGSQTPVTSAMAPSANAYSLTWSTVDDGGGTSTGGAYALSGTIGQPDAGALSGGAFALQSGFWGNFRVSVGDLSVYLPLIRR